MSTYQAAAAKIRANQKALAAVLPPLDVHPGVYLRDELLPTWGLSKVELTTRMGISRPPFYQVLAGRSDISRELAYKLGALFGDELADFLIAYQHAFDLERDRARRDGLRSTIKRVSPPA